MTPIYNREIMTILKCGCHMTENLMNMEKEIRNENGLIEHTHRMTYYYKHYINICGNCRSKTRIFNELEEQKLDIEKQQFKLLCVDGIFQPETAPDD